MREYLTIEEFRLGFDNLTELEIKKIILVGKTLCSKYRLYRFGIDSDELLNEAFERFLIGSRNLPNDVKFINAFTYALGSIAQGIADNSNGVELLSVDTLDNDNEELLPTSSFEDNVIEEEGHIEKNTKIAKVFEYFRNDKNIILILEAKLEDMKPNEIIENHFNGNRTQYETTDKRYRRGLVKFLAQSHKDE